MLRPPNNGLQRTWPSFSGSTVAGSQRHRLRAAQCCCRRAGHAAEAQCYTDMKSATGR